MITLLIALALADAPESEPKTSAISDVFAYERDVSELCFPSGLRVTVIRDDRQPVVSVSTVVAQGASHDPVGREGSAHLVEHLWFHAETSDGTVQERLEDLGVTFNAYTLGDATVYLSQADVAVLPQLVELEALRLADVLFGVSAQVVEQERAIVTSEHALRGLIVTDYPRFMPPGFGGNERGLRPRSQQALEAISMADLGSVRDGYVPGTTTIQITGPVDAEAVQAMVEDSFSEEQRTTPAGECGGRAEATQRSPPSLTRRGRPHIVRRQVEKPVVLVGWSLPAAYGQTEPMMRLLTDVMNHNLRDSLSHDRFRGAQTGCVFVPSPESSSVICAASVPAGANGGLILERLTEAGGELELSRDLVSAMQQAVRVGVADTLLGLDAVSPLRSDEALQDVLANHYGGSPLWFVDSLVARREMQLTEVKRFSERWTRPGQGWLSVVLSPGAELTPVLEGHKPSKEEVTLQTVDAPNTPIVSAGSAVHRGPTGRSAPTNMPAPAPPVLAEPVGMVINNGMRLVVLQHGDVPVSHMALVVDGAASTESRLGVDAWAWMMSGLDLSDYDETPETEADTLAARLWILDKDHVRGVGLSGSDVSMDEQLGLLRLYGEHAVSLGDLTRQELRAGARLRARLLRRDPAFVHGQAQWLHVLGDDTPYAFHSMLLENRGARAGVRRTQHHIRTLWHPENATLYVVGAMDADVMVSKAVAMFSSWEERTWKGWGPPSSASAVPNTRIAFEQVDERRTDAQVTLRCRTPDGTPVAVVDVATQLLQDWGHSALRESEIAAYNPSATSHQWGDASVMSLSATVESTRAAATAVAMDEGLRWLAEQVTNDDATRVAVRLRAGWTGQFVQSSQVLEQLIVYGQDVAAVAQARPDEWMSVRAEHVHAVARTCSMSASLGIATPHAGAVSGSPWADVLTEASLPGGM